MTRATLPPTWIATQGRARPLRDRLMARRGMPMDQSDDLRRRLSRLHGEGELKAALLGLLLTPGSRRELRAWRDELADVTDAVAILADVQQLDPAARLPWLELFAERAAQAPVTYRQAIVHSARALMQADLHVRDHDRLRWLALRQWLGDPRPRMIGSVTDNGLETLHSSQVEAIGVFTAFLSRMVPELELRSPDDTVPDGAPASDGELWYLTVMARWEPRVPIAPRGRPDSDAMLRSLRGVQALPWMQRPVLARAWYDAAAEVLEGDALPIESADAMRLACTLLDCPMPVELSQQYFEALRKS